MFVVHRLLFAFETAQQKLLFPEPVLEFFVIPQLLLVYGARPAPPQRIYEQARHTKASSLFIDILRIIVPCSDLEVLRSRLVRFIFDTFRFFIVLRIILILQILPVWHALAPHLDVMLKPEKARSHYGVNHIALPYDCYIAQFAAVWQTERLV